MDSAIIAPGSPEWFEARAGMWTGSRAKELMTNGQGKAKADEPGETARNYAFEVASARLANRSMAKDVSTWQMQRGEQLEPEAADAYVLHTMRRVTKAEWLVHPDFPTVGATNDGGLVDEDGLLEIKCPETAWRHLAQVLMANTDQAHKGAAAVEYAMQVQWELWVSRRAWCDVVSYHPSFPVDMMIAIVRVKPDLDLHAKFAKRVKWAEEYVAKIMADARPRAA